MVTLEPINPDFEAIVLMAKTLGMNVIAERVETTEQLELLKGYGCEFAQGYLLGEPVPVEKLSNLSCSVSEQKNRV